MNTLNSTQTPQLFRHVRRDTARGVRRARATTGVPTAGLHGDQEVLRLDVPVDHVVPVAELDRLDQLPYTWTHTAALETTWSLIPPI